MKKRLKILRRLYSRSLLYVIILPVFLYLIAKELENKFANVNIKILRWLLIIPRIPLYILRGILY